MIKFFVTLFMVTILSAPVVAQSNEDSLFIRKLANEILSNGKAYQNLETLTKKIGNRLAGSPASYKATEWGDKLMKESGADSSWLQECLVPHWVRGGVDEAYIVDGRNKKSTQLKVLALGNSVGTGKPGITAPVLLINSFDELEQRKEEVKGKIVFYNYKFKPNLVQTFLAYGDANAYRSQGPARASKFGALAVLTRSLSHSTDNFPHTGSTSYGNEYPKIPAAALGLKDADQLANAVSKGSVSVHLKTNGKMLPDTVGYNVIGEIRGSQYPNEYITVGGHLDSWDIGEGAHDDGAGCVQTIEILRALKAIGHTPKRTIRFVLFANEENGLRGGTKYASEAQQKNEKHVFALESDAGGFTPRAFGFSGSPEQLQQLRSWISLLQPYGVYEINAGGGGADIGPLSRTQKTPVAGLQPDSQRYFDIHHADSDRLEAVNKRELELGAINMAALIYLVDKYGL